MENTKKKMLCTEVYSSHSPLFTKQLRNLNIYFFCEQESIYSSYVNPPIDIIKSE